MRVILKTVNPDDCSDTRGCPCCSEELAKRGVTAESPRSDLTALLAADATSRIQRTDTEAARQEGRKREKPSLLLLLLRHPPCATGWTTAGVRRVHKIKKKLKRQEVESDSPFWTCGLSQICRIFTKLKSSNIFAFGCENYKSSAVDRQTHNSLLFSYSALKIQTTTLLPHASSMSVMTKRLLNHFHTNSIGWILIHGSIQNKTSPHITTTLFCTSKSPPINKAESVKWIVVVFSALLLWIKKKASRDR